MDKRALLDALATQLKHEKARAEDCAARMVRIEDEVGAKHREFLAEEARLSALRDQNAALIATLRRDLARARRTLEEALHVEPEEAEAYLALLSSEMQAAREDAVACAGSWGESRSDLGEGAGGYDGTYDDPASASRTPVNGGEFPPAAAPRPERPTALLDGHLFQCLETPRALPADMYPPDTAPISTELAHPELERNGGRWSRVFPGLIRRGSSPQTRG
ncbi:hypothetical protein JCM3770_003931 [Rhodotorula araucariae]